MRLSLFTLLLIASSFPVLANAQAGDEQAAEATNSATEYQALVATGIRRVALRDYARAADALRQALEIDPEAPEAHYYLACTLRQQGQLEDAVERFTALLSFATATPQPIWQRRASQGIAETLELIATLPAAGEAAGSRINQDALRRAEAGWRSALALADQIGMPELGAVAEIRIAAIRLVLTQEASSQEIRTRIAAREAELAAERAEQDSQPARGRR